MTLTRDQLRTARMLLHLQQDTMAALADVGVATIKRFETGTAIREAKLVEIRRSLEEAGAVFIDSGQWSEKDIGDGVALRRDLPDATRARIEADRLREAGRVEADQARRKVHRSEPATVKPRRKGRPKKELENEPEKPVDDAT